MRPNSEYLIDFLEIEISLSLHFSLDDSCSPLNSVLDLIIGSIFIKSDILGNYWLSS